MKARSILPILLLMLTVASCGRPGEVKEERERRALASKGDVVIGAAAPWALLEAQKILYWQGIEMARDEINSGGGVLGRKIRLIKEDDERTISKAKIVAQKFADNPDMVAVLGHYNSYISIPTSLTYEYNGLLMFSATSNVTRGLSDRKSFFRNVPREDEIARRLAAFAKKHGYERLMIYCQNDDSGMQMANAFEIRASELGCTIVDRLSYDSLCAARYFKKDLENWKKNFTFDAIFVAGDVQKSAEIIAQVRRLRINATVLGGDTLDSPKLWEIAGDSAEGTIAATFFHVDEPRPEVRVFDEAFSKRCGKQPDAMAAQGYDALKVLAYAMEQAGTTAPSKVSQALVKIKNWVGVTGPHAFNADGDVVDKPVILQVVRGKRFELLPD